MSAGHAPAVPTDRRHRRPLAIVFGMVASFMLVEFVAGLLTGSLSLVSDAGHMATDAIGLGMALAAITVSSRASANAGRTYGLYRLDILAALANAALLLGVAGYVVIEAIARMQDPPEVMTGPMLIVAIGGLVVNIVGWRLLRSGAEESLNVKGAYYEVIADLFGSIGVIAAALVMTTTGWAYADALFAGADRALHHPQGTDPRTPGAADSHPGCAQRGRPRWSHLRPADDFGGVRRPRSPRVDAHIGHGGSDRARCDHNVDRPASGPR